MSNNIYNANFWELLSKYQIEIPIIQRDYVQGREENKKIRKKIVSKFRKASQGNPTKLDFIYGNITNDVFYPLDGQQRLTTLFLYHLYFALRDNKLKEDSVNRLLSKFTYSTRVSSKEFFKKLLKTDIKIDVTSHLSTLITNQNWFITYWRNDPTVASALNMLDEIHLQCFESAFDFEKVNNVDNKDITFEFLELEKFGLSDDLYIKMNARGKTLSSFENFKADLIGYIKNNEWEINIPHNKKFATKLDGKWTDYFWDHGKNSLSFDSFFINFFHQFLITEIGTRSELSTNITDKYFTTDKHTFTQDELLAHLISNIDDLQEEYVDDQSFHNLYRLLEQYATVSKKLKVNSNLWINEFSDVDNLLSGTSRITYPNRIFHFAHSCYLMKNAEYNNEDYNKWMRVVRNIITNSTIDTVETFRGALQLINEISKGSDNIYKFLSQDQVKSRFAERQIKEEIRKSKLLITEIISYESLTKAEDTRLCYGRIEFILNYIDHRENGDYSKVENITQLFNRHFYETDFSNEIRALFLTCGDGKFYNYWTTSWVYIVELPKRCLIESSNELRNYSYNQSFRHYFYDVVERLLLNENVGYHLDAFKSSEQLTLIPQWKQKIISDYKILDKYCKSKMIAVAHDDSKCYVMNVGKPRSKESLKKLI